MAVSSTTEELPPQHQVFINYQLGEELCNGFVIKLAMALESKNINVFIDFKVKISKEGAWKKIEESRIALVIFSKTYTESTWCLKELTKIKDCVEKGTLVAIPIYYKLDVSTVRNVSGQFGNAFRGLVENDWTEKKKWTNALRCISNKVGVRVSVRRSEGDIIKHIVKEVEKVLKEISSEGSQKAYVELSNGQTSSGFGKEELEEKLDLNNCKETRIIGKVGSSSVFTVEKRSLQHRGVDLRHLFMALECYIYTDFPRSEIREKAGSSASDIKTNYDFLDSQLKPPQIQVFINFRGEQLRYNFVGYLVDALRRSKINVFIDNHTLRGEDLNTLFKRIEDSGIAIVVFSSRYTESKWCLEELVKIKERVHQGQLKVLPIFYKVSPTNVKRLKGEFGDHFRDKEYKYESDEPMIKRWKEAIAFVSRIFALTLDEKSVLEIDFVETIVKEVLKMLQAMSTVESGQSSH